ncbi:uncharacterized protein LOC135090606 isoform X1 [Scylla paramamosain]|uniref:uncharacterized protein LOC135090606 isoform X1 n=1 Tax=Scylla paramamosain TaxID=85552 RepID=UPI003083640C
MSRGKRHEEGQGERGGAAPPWPPSAPGTSAMIPPPRDTLVHLSSEYKNIIRRLQKVSSLLSPALASPVPGRGKKRIPVLFHSFYCCGGQDTPGDTLRLLVP